MAAGKLRNHPRRTRRRERRIGTLSRRATVWLATLSTVVGVATGMFTLRDQVFPGERGTARAVNEGAFRAHVGRICDAVNDSERARRRDDRRLARELAAARTTTGQRNALLDSARRAESRSSHTLAEFAGMSVSPRAAAAHRTTVAAWRRNLERVLEYIQRLDRVAQRPSLLAAVDFLSVQRSALARDGLRINEGLERLGGENCDIDPPVVTKAITLPGVPGRVNEPKHSADSATQPRPRATPSAPSRQPSPEQESGPRVNAPAPSNPPTAATPDPRVNTPPADGPTGGGGGDG
jgi:hypothetical protein